MPYAEAAAAIGGALKSGIELVKEIVANPRDQPGPAAYLYPYLREANRSELVSPPL